MAFQNKNLSVIAYANGFTLWLYEADEPMEHVLRKGFFNPVSTLCHNGDIIYITHCGDLYIRAICIKNGDVILQMPK